MTQSENPYRQSVFLEDLRDHKDLDHHRIWAEHQEMQLSFMHRRGLTSSSTVLDLGCGPMRLGSVLIPLLKDGWYYGQDINPSTIAFGEEVLREAGIPEQAPYTLFASDQFVLELVDRPVEIAFANSLFSHLTLNSIFTALLQLQTVLARLDARDVLRWNQAARPIRFNGDTNETYLSRSYHTTPFCKIWLGRQGSNLMLSTILVTPLRPWGGSAGQGSSAVC